MVAPLLLAGLWVVAAMAVHHLPARVHWLGLALLILAGIPLLGWVTYRHGPFLGMFALILGAASLYWPVGRFGGRLRRPPPEHVE
ncbi:DUF2484 family protein [Cereibacter sphaeroides]|jgi:NADPH:quinone reductase-like Zn-dependent oxidoreductase|uniref:DUF2484 family protein n=1 Tax=Cereibacter sphaeroides TaxID=1063 RepID=UPI000066465E|nr:DUF2484 family protein [Cereibacter sphaeroides]ABN75896.1 hypothetical protein Rsph17029_0785 [Cereibacter sphaeroides ATCC 17029]ACM00279.1 Hypothetical Protein RSKD131_0419 [Cereibacter sphaeroides KD131]AZB56092.1 DUF2484 family protein [Cereibacter sphaeroides]AZB60353.1 DUF2484 family protein [Cereibacter sphaeroides]AZB64520.1 DUF2484 family protein [Cereibacter sphaeroides]